ncbi:MAG: hypothetical protein EA385_15185 [Salinarimonadaceae bacterium]|nr:MAG: hypothetical protein EA385_15185 [Salinarimonadaceae bacterium]
MSEPTVLVTTLPKISLNAFHEWFVPAKPGESIVYHAGSLANDRLECPELDLLASTILGHAEKDRVRLSQRRHPLGFEYVVTKAG